jgi:pilus assembly protein CpaE
VADKSSKKGSPVTGALISRDTQFRESLVEILEARPDFVSLDVEIQVPFMEISDKELSDLKVMNPEIIFLDLEDDPHIGLKFAQYLSESGELRTLVGVGPELPNDLLLQAMQSGISEYLPKPINAESLNGAIERLWRRTGRKAVVQERAPGQMIAIFSPKGGSGSTTLAVNLAVQMNRLTREKTLILDLDLELGETALHLGIEPRFSVVDLIRNFHRADSGLLASYIERHDSGVEVLAAPIKPADVEMVSEDQIRKILQFLKRYYDYIIVDTPKSFGATTLAAFESADQMFLLTAADLPSLRNMMRCLPLLQNLDPRRGPDWMRLIVNRYESKGMISLGEVESMLGMKVFWTLRNDYEAVLLSANTGEPIVLTGGSDFARDVRALGAEITGIKSLKDAPKNWIKSMVGKPLRNVKVPSILPAQQEAIAHE